MKIIPSLFPSFPPYLPCLLRQEETWREGDALLHRCGGGLRCLPIGSHQIADFDGGGGPLGLIAPDTGHRTQSAPRPRVPVSPRHPVDARYVLRKKAITYCNHRL